MAQNVKFDLIVKNSIAQCETFAQCRCTITVLNYRVFAEISCNFLYIKHKDVILFNIRDEKHLQIKIISIIINFKGFENAKIICLMDIILELRSFNL